MSQDDNPYTAPSAALVASTTDHEASEFRLFLRWEKLRLLYNGILLTVTLLALVASPIPRIWTAYPLISLVVLCLAANVCYCLGPVINGYAYWFGLRNRLVTIFLFSAGTLFSVVLALAALSSIKMTMLGFD
jgi:hypothetical protein